MRDDVIIIVICHTHMPKKTDTLIYGLSLPFLAEQIRGEYPDHCLHLCTRSRTCIISWIGEIKVCAIYRGIRGGSKRRHIPVGVQPRGRGASDRDFMGSEKAKQRWVEEQV